MVWEGVGLNKFHKDLNSLILSIWNEVGFILFLEWWRGLSGGSTRDYFQKGTFRPLENWMREKNGSRSSFSEGVLRWGVGAPLGINLKDSAQQMWDPPESEVWKIKNLSRKPSGWENESSWEPINWNLSIPLLLSRCVWISSIERSSTEAIKGQENSRPYLFHQHKRPGPPFFYFSLLLKEFILYGGTVSLVHQKGNRSDLFELRRGATWAEWGRNLDSSLGLLHLSQIDDLVLFQEDELRLSLSKKKKKNQNDTKMKERKEKEKEQSPIFSKLLHQPPLLKETNLPNSLTTQHFLYLSLSSHTSVHQKSSLYII